MKYVNLGRSGLKVSRLCLGCMSYGEPEQLVITRRKPEALLPRDLARFCQDSSWCHLIA